MLDSLTVPSLKKVIRQYNLHTVIKGYSTMPKSQLINEIQKRLHYEGDKLVIKSNSASIEIPKPTAKKQQLKNQ